MTEPLLEEGGGTPSTARSARLVPAVIVIGAALLTGVGATLLHRAEASTNGVALSSAPKPVTTIAASEATFRASRKYVGTLEPWVRADIGPQLVSAYVDTLLVRPGAIVKKGEVLATLDCRNASATSQAVSMQARALDERQKALAHEASRVQGLLEGGFVSSNEAEQKAAQSASEKAQLLATQAKLLGTTLEVNDCILRAPFDGEITTRAIDPGAFVRPGVAIVSVVDRSMVRIAADAPEVDFDVIAPGTPVKVHVLSTGTDIVGKVSRRAPAADDATRTVHFEIDVPNSDRAIPVGTTGEIQIDVGEPRQALKVPLSAVSVRGSKASFFVVEGGVAHLRSEMVLGEIQGEIFLNPDLNPGSLIVTEGQALLSDGDKVTGATESSGPVAAAPEGSAGRLP